MVGRKNSLVEHLRSRHMDLSLYSSVHVNEAEYCATFYLWNLSGQLVGYQVYRPDKVKGMPKGYDPKLLKYYTYISRQGGVDVCTTAWGLETVRPGARVYVCEGVFDACRLHKAGLPALALVGNDPKHLRSWLGTLPNTLVSVVQGDSAGKALAKYGQEAVLLPAGKDVGDLADEEFKSYFCKGV